MKMKLPNRFTIKLSLVFGVGYFTADDDKSQLIKVLVMPFISMAFIYNKPIIVIQ